MEIYSYKNKELEAERDKYRRDIATLEATEGWVQLTEKQRQIIRVSLFLQDRAERDMHPDHKNDPFYYDWFKRTGYHPEYQKSLEHIKKLNCHSAVSALESGNLKEVKHYDLQSDFFHSAYFPIYAEFDLVKAINFIGFPSVVHISSNYNNDSNLRAVTHTFLVLGPLQDQEMIAWEKQGYSIPYRVTSVSDIYSEYKNNRYWGIRKLR